VKPIYRILAKTAHPKKNKNTKTIPPTSHTGGLKYPVAENTRFLRFHSRLGLE
jgi:hypothetical protein